MDDLVHPGEHVPAELQLPQLPVLLEPSDALCFGLVWVKVSQKIQAMAEVEILGYLASRAERLGASRMLSSEYPKAPVKHS